MKNHLVFNLTRSTFLKASINWHRLRNSLVCRKPADCVQTSPRLCNLYLALKKVLNAKKIEVQDGFSIPTVREMLCKGIEVILKCLIFNCCRGVVSVKKNEYKMLS